jgi:hypothetical protein
VDGIRGESIMQLPRSFCLVICATNFIWQPASGQVVSDTDGTRILEVSSWPKSGQLIVPTPFPQITGAYLSDGVQRKALPWTVDLDTAKIELELPSKTPESLPAKVILETGDKTAQFSGGRIVFSAFDTRGNGSQRQIGFGSRPQDSMVWEFKPTRWGMYDIELTCAAVDGSGVELQFNVAGKLFTILSPATGSWNRYVTLPVGRFYLEEEKPLTLRMSCKGTTGKAVMNFKAITFRPAREGSLIKQEGTVPIMLHASNAITHSVTMRYEPKEEKRCLGYWINPQDWAEWEFEVTKPGTFEVEIKLGCGKGNGGSDVQVEVGAEKLTFKVEETGDYHKYTQQRIGSVKFTKSGIHSLVVRPQNKRAGAVMDIRQVDLIPLAMEK